MKTSNAIPGQARVERLRLAVRGAVQGVGFRPFVHRLAGELRLAGWVNNSPQGVLVELEGPRPALDQLLLRLEAERPPRSSIQSLEATWLDPVGYHGFEIRESETTGERIALVLPDIATCSDCRREIFDPANRRYRYPFTNCTNCGPRFSIIEALPYDRANTSMKAFPMCPACRAEYDDPTDRRFHAQPNACPVCGPWLELWPASGQTRFRNAEALLAAAEAIRLGQVVAVKGIGGFHLLVDARNEAAVRRLRERKLREEKPLALMFPTVDSVQAVCAVSALEERLLRSPEAPIVLLRRRPTLTSHLSTLVAPGNPNLGVLLPYSPLHLLLMAELNFPVVATSGNLSDEPICTDEREALDRLGGIADVFLVHNRPIVRHVDDSIVRVMLDREMVLRRARGYAPLPVAVKSAIRSPQSEVTLAVGAHLKNSVALAIGPQIFISQHLGDLETEPAHAAFRRVIADFQSLFAVKPEVVAADLHPDYLSTRFAVELTRPPAAPDKPKLVPQPRHVGVQHHIAHVLSCMAENELTPPVLGVSWDGTGYGLDGTIWGGEFFSVTQHRLERVAHLRPFRLPGGEMAIKEPRRAALGLLHELTQRPDKSVLPRQSELVRAFSPTELGALQAALARGINSPWCSSVGRLFDAVAAIIGLRTQTRFEGQAAMELEFALEGVETDEAYSVEIQRRELQAGEAARGESEIRNPKSEMVLDWSPMIAEIAADLHRGVGVGLISARFHNALAEVVVAVAKRVGEARVALSGGCFQNRYLTEQSVRRLRAEGFQPYWHQRVPPNDGGISLGQAVAALRAVQA
jgi:hydrogenase maturation protein HypF